MLLMKNETESNIYIFGNSPKFNINHNISSNDDIAGLGWGIEHLKERNIKYWFTRSAKFDMKFSNLAENVILLSSDNNYKIDNISHFTTSEARKYSSKYNLKTPSLGVFSIIFLMDKYDKIFISGIVSEINDEYIDSGYFWNKKQKLSNMQHDIFKEALIVRKMKKEGLINEF